MVVNTMFLTLSQEVPLAEAEGTLRLARMAVEGNFGVQRTALEAQVTVDRALRQFEIDVTRDAGRMLGLIFVEFLRREFGAGMVRVEHSYQQPQPAGAMP